MKLFNTIKRKIVTTVFAISFLLLVLFSVLNVSEIRKNEYANLDSMTTTINAMLIKHISGYVFEHDKKNLQLSIESIESQYIKSVTIFDHQGVIIVSSAKTIDGQRAKLEALLLQKNYAVKTRDEYLILNSFDVLDIPIGYLLLEADLSVYHQAVENRLEKLFLFLLFSLLVLFFISLFIADSVSRPIEFIIYKLSTVKENEMLVFKKFSQSEFQFLALSVTKMHNKLSILNHSLQNEVNKKTASLQRLNEGLTNKIEDEISKSRKKDQTMREQSRLAQMGEMISMIAHQWRQPLSAITVTSALI